MQITNFIANLEGKWLRKETLYSLVNEKIISNQSKVYYKSLTHLQQKFPNLNSYTAKYKIFAVLEILWENQSNKLAHIICFYQLPESISGQFIQWNQNTPHKLIKGDFYWNNSKILNVVIKQGNTSIQEKIYTPIDKLKLVNNIRKKFNICVSVLFISEIKLN
uniref:chromophore lyase cpcS/cpeS n=1 Tax=Stylonema alsidii TaxID=35155 RepID=UPI001FCD9609|nr:chromophore lyase cpcS/cpeS [Stylonema alsidii]UNJ15283.1 chromophore lyase cpcS/cpeS [Stylonema alsidii]